MEIKNANITDMQKINDLYFACSEDMKNKLNLNHWENQYPQGALKNRIQDNKVYIAVSDTGEIQGSFMLEDELPQIYSNSMPSDNHSFRYLSRLAVSPNVQSNGIGELLLRKAERIAKSEGADVMRLDYLTDYTKLGGFYLKRGYIHVGEGQTRRFNVSFMEKIL